MTWTAYSVTLRLLSPIHIGWRKLGNLQQTRPYVTGRNLWGALTARLTRDLGCNQYDCVGKLVDDCMRFTYFYPSVNKDSVEPWPWWKNDAEADKHSQQQSSSENDYSHKNKNQWDKFAWTFLSSYTSTALENGRSAEAGSLHETEFIAPHTRDGNPVYLVGYIFKQEGCQLKWKKALDKIQLGGERSYGWGRVRLEGGCEPVAAEKCFGYDLDLDGVCPQIIVPNGSPLLAHTEAEGFNDVSSGTIEPLVGRETNDKEGFGKNHSNAVICWTPGSIVKVDKEDASSQKFGADPLVNLGQKHLGENSSATFPQGIEETQEKLSFQIHARGIWKVTTT